MSLSMSIRDGIREARSSFCSKFDLLFRTKPAVAGMEGRRLRARPSLSDDPVLDGLRAGCGVKKAVLSCLTRPVAGRDVRR